MCVTMLHMNYFWCAADFFLEHGERERGVQLLIQARQPSRALDLCHQHNITITEVSRTHRLLLFNMLWCGLCCSTEAESVLCAQQPC